MAEIQVRRSISIEATTVGDVAKWLQYVEGLDGIRMTTQLLDPMTLEVDVTDSVKPTAQQPAR